MAEQVEQVEQEAVAAQADDDDEDETPGYKPPAAKTLDDICKQDQDDESLNKYKKTLLGEGGSGDCLFPDDQRNVIIKKMSLEAEGRDAIEMDLTKTTCDSKNLPKYSLKEGVKYHLKIDFVVQREIVTGLKYHQQVYRKGFKVDKQSCMVGSYGPGSKVQSFKTTEEEAPSGLVARGDYKIKSKFTDDDKNEYVTWEWQLSIKKDWD